jgi:RNA polymerase sigma factor (TIGR02999 family)
MLLRHARQGDNEALAALFEMLYPELRRIARHRLARDDGGTSLNTTALVNECYLKFARSTEMQPADRIHFLSYAASAMRSIVIDAARARLAERRGGGLRPVTLNSALISDTPSGEEEVIAVHEALQELAALDGRLARVVEMRYFGGLSDEEIGEVLEVNARTVRRDWEKARLILSQALRKGA